MTPPLTAIALAADDIRQPCDCIVLSPVLLAWVVRAVVAVYGIVAVSLLCAAFLHSMWGYVHHHGVAGAERYRRRTLLLLRLGGLAGLAGLISGAAAVIVYGFPGGHSAASWAYAVVGVGVGAGFCLWLVGLKPPRSSRTTQRTQGVPL